MPVYHSALPFPVEGGAPFGSAPTDGPETWPADQRALDALSAMFDRRVAQAARKLGLAVPPTDLLGSPTSPDLNVLMTVPELEPGLRPLEGPVLMGGPCLPRPRPSDASDPALNAPRPRSGPRIWRRAPTER